MEWAEEAGIPKRWKIVDKGQERRLGTSIISAEVLKRVSSFEELFQVEVSGGIKYAVRCLSRQAIHSAKLVKMLRRHFVSDEAAQAIVAYCRRQGWLDDAGLVEAKINAWQRLGKSPAYIRAKLREQGIEATVTCDEDAALARIISKKYKQLLDPAISRQECIRATQALLRRGFSYQKVKEFLHKNARICMMEEE